MTPDYCPKISTINVEKLRLRAYIGFIDWEKIKLQDLVISFSFKYDTKAAAATDNVADAVDYKRITKTIIKMVDQQQFHLIETVAENIYDYIRASSPLILDLEVKVEKPHALRFSENVFVKISSKDRYNVAMVALGSNIEAEENFAKALEFLRECGKIVQRSEFIYTRPLKFEDQPEFLNGAVLLYTKENLNDLKLHLKELEARLGRVRTENKNAPRTIDLDVTTFNGFIIDKEIEELPFLIDFVRQLQPEIAL